ncbi:MULTISPECIES: hypothetical protein [unclassified Methylophaga]|jgi:hypothetical protein|uniref:hypothetical protein n=1 Tax=unclassified Methylophaga TaxID=2629249 RepID=UPI00259C6856|nr:MULTISPECIES: hypothetical protein [unclassified Methylophaga]|tara:strand:+ start:35921 stop:36340 length:420 start_codon:yes stop_codon:yes gene_type:complete
MAIYISTAFPHEWAERERREESAKEIAYHLLRGSQIIIDDGTRSKTHFDIKNISEMLWDKDPNSMDTQIQMIGLGSSDITALRVRIAECADKVANDALDMIIDLAELGYDVEENTLKTVKGVNIFIGDDLPEMLKRQAS